MSADITILLHSLCVATLHRRIWREGTNGDTAEVAAINMFHVWKATVLPMGKAVFWK